MVDVPANAVEETQFSTHRTCDRERECKVRRQQTLRLSKLREMLPQRKKTYNQNIGLTLYIFKDVKNLKTRFLTN
jgi:hypothetical protein